ncbi:hypothetical protein [Sphingomonas sp. CFBP 13706]|uniref:hypothetical protein n=1 Tax=Sphingomonas sp. CFBP 13706 TaxID=2775314 RepID=UPI001784B745|nr:hypothetical protein [Sphingomonas sp. CFBP 13706]MBD8736236.1 hypothetical protein [Sphingomonas sp. CFBP 13706]
MSDQVEAFSLDAFASITPEARRMDAQERSDFESWIDEQAAAARAGVEDMFATGVLGFGKDRVLGPVLIANRASIEERIRGNTIPFGDVIVALDTASSDVWADYDFDQT